MTRPFHLAMPVADIAKAKHFYGEILGCRQGRSSETWVDFDFFGHQVVFHLDKGKQPEDVINPVDSKHVPVPHFGVILKWQDWEILAEKIKANQIEFIIAPCIRFKDKSGEQGTFFIKDSNGLNLEFKTFKDDKMIFET